MKILFLDTETTGVEPGKHAVIQIAGIVDIDGQVAEEFEFFCAPLEGQFATAKALEVNGRTIEEIKTFPPAREAYKSLKEIFAKYVNPYSKDVRQRFVIGGQNIEFDYKMMEALWRGLGDKYWYSWVDRRGVDTMVLTAAFQAADLLDLPNFKLETVAGHFGVPIQAHDAMSDVRAAREIFWKYVGIMRGVNGKLQAAA